MISIQPIIRNRYGDVYTYYGVDNIHPADITGNNNITIPIPDRQIWLFSCVRFNLNTSATAGNRILRTYFYGNKGDNDVVNEVFVYRESTTNIVASSVGLCYLSLNDANRNFVQVNSGSIIYTDNLPYVTFSGKNNHRGLADQLLIAPYYAGSTTDSVVSVFIQYHYWLQENRTLEDNKLTKK